MIAIMITAVRLKEHFMSPVYSWMLNLEAWLWHDYMASIERSRRGSLASIPSRVTARNVGINKESRHDE
jgi:hypothetical protein